MPDGTGEDDYGSPTFTQLKQMSWDLSYIRDKLTLGGVSKTFVWRRESGHQAILGSIELSHSNILGLMRGVAARIQAGEDGPAPPVNEYGQSGWTQTQLLEMYDGLIAISSKIITGKRTFTMRMSGMAGSNVELAIGDASTSSVSYRLAIKYLAAQIADGRG